MKFDIEFTAPGLPAVGGWRTGPIIPSLGYGGHPIGARPKKKALTVWEGRQPFQMEVPVLLDLGGELVEGLRSTLDRMATSVNAQKPPPVRIISNRGKLPIPADIPEAADWWIEDLKWGDEKRRASDGELVRQEVTVTLLERIDDPLLFATSGPKVRTNRAHNYVVKKGDTLHSIAAKELGNTTRWREIGALNHIRSDGQLKPGRVIHIPATTGAGFKQP